MRWLSRLRALRSSVAPSSTGRQAALLRSMLGPLPWCVDDITLRADVAEVRGWALAAERPARRPTISWNGETSADVEYGMTREDIGQLFWFVPGAERSGYVCRVNAPRFVSDEAELQLDAGAAAYDWHAYAFLDPRRERYAVPDREMTARALGGMTECAYRLEGYSTATKLSRALQQYGGRPPGAVRQVLDWGCGCGRLTRYLDRFPGASVTAVDIDGPSVDWCREHLPFVQALAIPLHPPTPLPSRTFDLIIGISVFTHLSEPVQFEWLDELRRIAAPGASILMTVHGEAAAARSRWPESMIHRWRAGGFVDGISADLNATLPEADYYRCAYHTPEYVRRRWSRFFDIVAIVPSCIGNYHDLVVMRNG